MGDFDKPQAGANAASGEKKKLVMVGLLGAVLLSVLGYHFFLHGGPQTAVAGDMNTDLNAGMVPTQETPAQALAALDSAHDPTAKLLTTPSTLPADFLEVPRDPFRISDKWRAKLIKPVPEKAVVAVHHGSPHTAAPTPSAAPKISPDGFKLTGIFQQGKTLYATINGNLVTVGATIGEACVVEIRADKVLLQHVDAPDGPLTTITIQGTK